MTVQTGSRTRQRIITRSVCLQIALIDLLTNMGLQPDGIIGHSVGELACGYADGSLSHDEAILAAYWRGLCIKEAKLPPGAMAAVGKERRKMLICSTIQCMVITLVHHKLK